MWLSLVTSHEEFLVLFPLHTQYATEVASISCQRRRHYCQHWRGARLRSVPLRQTFLSNTSQPIMTRKRVIHAAALQQPPVISLCRSIVIPSTISFHYSRLGFPAKHRADRPGSQDSITRLLFWSSRNLMIYPLLRCYTAWIGRQLPTFLGNIMVPSSSAKWTEKFRSMDLYREHSLSDLLLLVHNRSRIQPMFRDIWFPRLASSWDCLTHFSVVLIITTKIALLHVPKTHITAGLISDWSVVEYMHMSNTATCSWS